MSNVKLLYLCHKLKICQDVVNVMRYIHANDIIHRDITTRNILLSVNVQHIKPQHICDLVAQVTDFGLGIEQPVVNQSTGVRII